MRWPFTKSQSTGLLALFFALGWEISESSNYENCKAPIQIFLISFWILLIVFFAIFYLLEAQDLPHSFRKYSMLYLNWTCGPFFFGLSFLGFFWQKANKQSSPECWSWTAYFATAFALLLGGLLIIRLSVRVLIMLTKYLYKGSNILSLDQSSKYGEESVVLNRKIFENEVLNRKIGLLPLDIDKLEKREFSETFPSMLLVHKFRLCPLCPANINLGEMMICLPKCGHIFHANCITDSLLKIPLCPLCRRNVRSDLYGDGRQYQEFEGLLRVEQVCKEFRP